MATRLPCLVRCRKQLLVLLTRAIPPRLRSRNARPLVDALLASMEYRRPSGLALARTKKAGCASPGDAVQPSPAAGPPVTPNTHSQSTTIDDSRKSPLPKSTSTSQKISVTTVTANNTPPKMAKTTGRPKGVSKIFQYAKMSSAPIKAIIQRTRLIRELDQLLRGDHAVSAAVPTPTPGDCSSLLPKSLKDTAIEST